MHNLEVFRGQALVSTIPVNENVLFSRTLMQEHRITVNDMVLPDAIDIQLNDYVIYRGIKYTINTVPNVKADNQYNYNIVFEGPEYTLYDKLIFHEGVSDFPYFGTAQDHLQLLLNNINELDPGWTIGTVDVTSEQFDNYINVSCRVALGQISEKFKLEYHFTDKVISLVKQVGNVTTHAFEYGRGKGLYSLTRTYLNEDNVKTKIYGFGSTRNLPANYRGGLSRLTFSDKFISRNTGIYGVKEATNTNDEIFPTREGEVTGVFDVDDKSEIFKIADSTLDFNINDYRLSGVQAKIGFIDGELTGEEFDLIDYNHSSKVLTLKSYTNNANVRLPSLTFKPELGNKYRLLDIELPQVYVDQAEAAVESDTLSFALQNSIPKVEYSLEMDLLYVKNNQVELNPGDKVRVVNTALGVNDLIRVLSVTYPISFPDILTQNTKYTVTIANSINYTVQERVTAQVLANKTAIKLVDRRNIELARRNANNFRDLQDLIYDPDGYFDTGNIKPGSIETLLLAVGAKSQNFRLNDVVFTLNYGGMPNNVLITAGTLQHYELQIDGLGYSWAMPGTNIALSDSNKPYYLYAKVSKTALTGEWLVSEVPVLTESAVGYYNLVIGIIYKVKDGYRDYDFTYGQTSIVGNNITTGKVQDVTKQNFFDLETGKFNLGPLEGNGVDWDVTTPGRFTIRGALTQNSGGITSPLTTFRGTYNNTATYYNGDTVTFGGSTWFYKSTAPTAGNEPSEGLYWTIYAQKGADGGTGTSVEIQYSTDGLNNWHSTFTVGDIFMRQRVGAGQWSQAIRIVGESGASSFTLVNKANMKIEGNKVTKVSGAGYWNAGVKSLEGYKNGAIISYKIPNTGQSYIMAGLSGNPDLSNSYETISYAIFTDADGYVKISEGGALSNSGIIWAPGEIFSLEYDGKFVRYYKGSVMFREVAALPDLTLYLDSSFVFIGDSLENLTFAPAGKAGNDGKYTSYEFAKNSSLTVAPTTGFTDAPPSLSLNEYLWTRIGTFGPSGQIGNWSTPVRISGPQGEPGVPGPNGANGESLYTWVKYADDAVGVGLSDYPAGKLYIGFAYNKPIPSESNNPADYAFSLITGEGAKGPPGENGQTLYTWVKYADTPTSGMTDSPAGKSYLGLAYNKTTATESSDYNDYSWSLIKGSQGEPGIQGPPGANGQTLYTWVKYAEDSAGNGLSDYPDGKIYIGFAYNKVTPVESDNAADYSFSLILGTTGPQGPPGANGQTLYTWIKYADDAAGNGLSDDPTGKLYLALAYNKTTATESNNAADYSYSLIRGAAGATGAPGAPGNYSEYRFAVNGSVASPPSLDQTALNPGGWSTTQPALGVGQYAWITMAIKNGTGTALVTNWGTPIRFNGADGAAGATGSSGAQGPQGVPGINGTNGTNGANGIQGPFMTYRGNYDNTKTYKGTLTSIETVKYSGSFYVTRTDAGTIPPGTLPTNAAYFNPYGAEFESVATSLLLADLAYITNLGVRNVRTSDSGVRVEISGDQNNLKFFDSANNVLIVMDDDAAFEGYTPATGLPRYGPGLAIGNMTDTGGYGQVSRYGLLTNNNITVGTIGNIDAIKFSVDDFRIRIGKPLEINSEIKVLDSGSNYFTGWSGYYVTGNLSNGNFFFSVNSTPAGFNRNRFTFKYGVLVSVQSIPN